MSGGMELPEKLLVELVYYCSLLTSTKNTQVLRMENIILTTGEEASLKETLLSSK